MRQGLFLFLLVFLVSASQAQAASVCAKKSCVDVEVVSEFSDLQRGLQGRDGLARGQGMLFVFDTDGRPKFWMKDMKFPIDMIWIDSQKRIVTVRSSCPACVKEPCEVYSSSKDARFVLEVPADFAIEHQFKEGQRLEFKDIRLKSLL